jgi:hypothetical protein
MIMSTGLFGLFFEEASALPERPTEMLAELDEREAAA